MNRFLEKYWKVLLLVLLGTALSFFLFNRFFIYLVQDVYLRSADYASRGILDGFVVLDDADVLEERSCLYGGVANFENHGEEDELYQTAVSGLVTSESETDFNLMIRNSDEKPYIRTFDKIGATTQIYLSEDSLEGSCVTLFIMNWQNIERPNYVFPEFYRTTGDEKYFLRYLVDQDAVAWLEGQAVVELAGTDSASPPPGTFGVWEDERFILIVNSLDDDFYPPAKPFTKVLLETRN